MKIIKNTSVYRLIERKGCFGKEYAVQICYSLLWLTIRIYHDEDDEYALLCATELFEHLTETI